jgi:hypothetical protein
MGRIYITPANVVVIGSVAILTLVSAKWVSAWMTQSSNTWLKEGGNAIQFVINAA